LPNVAGLLALETNQSGPCSLLSPPCILSPLTAPIAQSVERFHGKEKVNGSIPFGGSASRKARQSGVAQVVEQAAHNRCVAGSTPALATKEIPGQGILHPWIYKEGRYGKE